MIGAELPLPLSGISQSLAMDFTDASISRRRAGTLSAVVLFAVCGCSAQPESGTPSSKAAFDKVICRTLVYSPDGNQLAVGGTPKLLRVHGTQLWDAKTGTAIATFKNLGCETTGFSPDGKFLVTGGWLGEVSLWDGRTGDKLTTVTGRDRALGSLLAMPNQASEPAS